MVNIEQITSTLAKLPDQALQRYAMMHKDDPYIMSLAVSESKRRKEMRSANQGQMQPQPKVVDQAMAEMAALPEEQGIGALPVQMEFAEGGITGYAGGGEVERYQVGGSPIDRILKKSPYERTPEENLALREAGYAPQGRTIPADSSIASANTFLENLGPNIRGYFTEGKNRLSDEELANLPSTGGVMNERLLRSLGMGPSAPQKAPVTAASAAPAAAAQEAQYDPALATRRSQYEVPGKEKSQTTGVAGAGTYQAGPSAARAQPAAAAPNTDDMIARSKDIAGQLYDNREMDLLLGEMKNRATGRAEEMRERFKERPKTKAAEGLEKLLKEEEASESAEKDKSAGAAIFKAGIAMLGGTSANPFENISKGALAGYEEYSSAIKDFKKAAKDRQKLFAEIEEKRRLQEIGDFDAASALDDKIFSLQSNIQDKILSATEKSTGAKAGAAASLVGRELDQQAQERLAKQNFDRQVQLRGMPTYEQGLQKQYVQQWLKKPENAGKTELDAMIELGLLRSPGMERNPTPTDRLRAAQTMLENATTEAEANMARQEISQIMQGMRSAGSQSGAGAPPPGAVRLKSAG